METLENIQPKNSKDIVGNKTVIKRFKDHIKSGSNPKLLALIGPTGCGKSLVCELVFKELGMKCYDLSNKESIFNSKDTITSCFDKTKRVLLIDNIDVLMNTDTNILGAIKHIIPLLIKYDTYMVLTGKTSDQKTLLRFKDNIEVFVIGYPQTKDVFIYLSGCLDYKDEERLLSLVKAYRGNIREVVMNLEQTQCETNLVVKDRGFKEYNSFDIASSFMINPSWKLIDQVINVDPEIVSLLLYENILDEANCRDPGSVVKTYVIANKYMVEANKMRNTCNILLHGHCMIQYRLLV